MMVVMDWIALFGLLAGFVLVVGTIWAAISDEHDYRKWQKDKEEP